jgi:transcriptional regulator with XRE-family HTH domain
MWLTTIGDCVRKTRTERGWSQKTLAQHAGVSEAAVSAVENGQNPTSTSIDAVVGALGLAVVADCPAAGPDWERHYAAEVARLREAAERETMETKDAEELLHLCHFLIRTGRARGAVQALLRWRASDVDGPPGDGPPLPLA